MNPQGNIYLVNVPYEKNYKNLIDFENIEAQQTYFNSLVTSVNVFSNYTYIPREKTIKVNAKVDDIYHFNYLFYENVGFTNKRYYAFITDLQYINENTTLISFEIDVWQSYQFDISFNKSFIEREHVNDDSFGLHTLPENLETGEFKINSSIEDYDLYTDGEGIILACLVDPETGNTPAFSGGNYNGVFSGINYYYFKSITVLIVYLQNLDNLGKADAVTGIFCCPKKLIELVDETTEFYSLVKTSNFEFSDNWYINIPTSLNGYIPKNKKLFTSQYSFLNIDNNSGSIQKYLYERMNINDDNKALFEVISAVTPGMSVRVFPRQYNTNELTERVNQYGLNLGKFPTCSWTNDMYINWLTQNSLNIGVSGISSGLQIAGGLGLLATGGGAGAGASMLTSGVLGVASTLGSMQEKSTQPLVASGNLNSGDVSYASDFLTFSAYHMCPAPEYVEIIDNYFSQFGYKVAKLKDVDFTSRRYWNYIKTIDVNITGEINQNDLSILNQIFDGGTTIWHDASNIYNYNLNNYIV